MWRTSQIRSTYRNFLVDQKTKTCWTWSWYVFNNVALYLRSFYQVSINITIGFAKSSETPKFPPISWHRSYYSQHSGKLAKAQRHRWRELWTWNIICQLQWKADFVASDIYKIFGKYDEHSALNSKEERRNWGQWNDWGNHGAWDGT